MAERTFYRIVKADPPTRRDFLSNQARRGAFPPHLPPRVLRLWDGLSVHDSEANARRQAQESPWLGSFIARLRLQVPSSTMFRWERTIRNNAGHHTLWGDPDDLLDAVVEVVTVLGGRS